MIPNFNYGRYLETTVRSALDQPGVQVAVTILDDASTDDSAQIASRLAEDDSRVHLLRHSTNRGHIATFNEALESATGDYVVKLDSDDLLTPGSLARAAAVLDHFTDVSFVYGNALLFTDEAQIRRLPVRDSTSLQPLTTWRIWSGQKWLESRFRRGRNVIAQPEVMIRRSALESVGGHLPEVPAASDFNLWLRLATTGDVAHINGVLQGYYRLHQESMQRTIHSGVFADLGARRCAFELLFRDRGDHVQDAPRWQEQVRKTLAKEAIRLAHAGLDDGSLGAAEVTELVAFAQEEYPHIARSVGARSAVRRAARDADGEHNSGPFGAGRYARMVAAHSRWWRHRVTGL